MTFEPFDVVIVPFPYADRLAEKRRPAIVISKPSVSADYKLVWLTMITSADNPRWDCDIDITKAASTGLPAPSRIRPVKIATADVSRIVRRIGRLGAPDRKALRDMISFLIVS
jgi:mRNA interferase MazF